MHRARRDADQVAAHLPRGHRLSHRSPLLGHRYKRKEGTIFLLDSYERAGIAYVLLHKIYMLSILSILSYLSYPIYPILSILSILSYLSYLIYPIYPILSILSYLSYPILYVHKYTHIPVLIYKYV